MNIHTNHMKHCIDLAQKAMLNGDPPVGSILVKNNKVIGVGIEAGKSSNDITKHAEIEAIKDTLTKNELRNLDGCTLYTTHEPCIMCSYVIRHYRIGSIVYGTKVDYIGGITSKFEIIKSDQIPKWGKVPEIIPDILKEECQKL